MLIFGPEKSVCLRETHENVYGKLSRDFLSEKEKFSGNFREKNASFLVRVSLAFRGTNRTLTVIPN